MGGKILAKKDELVTVKELMRGTVLRGRNVSKAGKTSAAVFVPRYFLGMKVKLIILPEDEENIALSKALDERIKRVGKLQAEIKKLKSKKLEESDNATEADAEPVIQVDENLEGEDEY